MTEVLNQSKAKELEGIFYPRSAAVVGVSANEQKMGTQWFRGLLSSGFKGPIYGVSQSGGKVYGHEIYNNLTAIPGPVDLVVVCIPRDFVLDLLDDCAAKKVRAVQFFTAGFRETGEPKWAEVEKEMVRRARRGGFRIIGPNCFGIYCPEHGLPYGPWMPPGRGGSIAFISQSGGHAGKLLHTGLTRGIEFGKAVSMGNGSDLGSADFLEYFALDPGTDAIGLYLEGPTDSRQLLQKMQAASERKPIVVWKGGRTAAGYRATASHTGALAASASVWSGALRQAGAIETEGLEELADTLLLLQRVGPLHRSNLGIVCGLTDGGGGEAVLIGDACAAPGIVVPPLTEKTNKELLALLGQVGSVLSNPIDISQRGGNKGTLERTMHLLAADPQIDVVVVYENIDILSTFLGPSIADEMNEAVFDFRRSQSKPLVVVLPAGSTEPKRIETEGRLVAARIPVYPTMERAAKAISNVSRYYNFRAGAAQRPDHL